MIELNDNKSLAITNEVMSHLEQHKERMDTKEWNKMVIISVGVSLVAIRAYLTACWYDNTVYPEIPEENTSIRIFIETDKGFNTFLCFRGLNKSWFKSNVIRWAYPSDLIPKEI